MDLSWHQSSLWCSLDGSGSNVSCVGACAGAMEPQDLQHGHAWGDCDSRIRAGGGAKVWGSGSPTAALLMVQRMSLCEVAARARVQSTSIHGVTVAPRLGLRCPRLRCLWSGHGAGVWRAQTLTEQLWIQGACTYILLKV